MTSPVLVIHGTEDEVIDFSHGLAIYERCPRAVEPLWVEVRSGHLCFRVYNTCFVQGAGHNDVELYNQYLERLKTFVAHELTNWQAAGGGGDCPTPKNQKLGSKNAKNRVQGAPRDSSIDSTATVSTNSGASKPENPSEKLL